LPWRRDYNRWDRKASALIRKTEPNPLKIQYWAAKGRTVRITIKAKDDRVVYNQKHDSRRGINVVEWDLTVDRDAELKWQLKEARKKLKEATEKLVKAKDEPEKKAGDNDKITKLVKAEEEATEKVETIQRVIDEATDYADLPKGTRDRMVRGIYLPKGDYTVTVKQGKQTDSRKLTVGGDRKSPEKLDTKKKRAAETRRLLKEYEIEK